jgi:hypothetical protein
MGASVYLAFGCIEILVVESCLMGLANKYVFDALCTNPVPVHLVP